MPPALLGREALSAKPSLGTRWQALPGPWPQPRGRKVLCLLPVPWPAQLSHSQRVLLVPKLEQRRWVPSAAQELHSSSSQGLGKQKDSWL